MALYAEDEEYDLDGEESVMLDEELDENYEPTEDEIIEYAQFLGMDLNEDQDLLYIAKEGLKAPLPENYKPYRRRTGEIVYIDLRTNEFQEEHPCDEYYRNLYQEMKRKKAQRRTESKFKKNFPLGNKSSSPAKTEALPSFQTSSAQKKVPEKNILDKSMGSDHHDSLTSSVNDTSFNQMPGPLINKDNKKKAFGSNLQNSDMRVSLGASEGDGGYDNIDQDFEDKFFDYYKEREQEFNLSKKKLKEKEENQDQELKQKLEKEKKELKDKLKVQGEASRTKLAKDKVVWRKELQIESDANLEEEIKKEDKQHFANKRELDKSLAKKLEDELKDEEGKIEKEFHKKKEDLLEKKRDIQAEIEHVKQIEEEREKKDAQSLEDEKEYIIKGFSNQLREFEVQERVKQENEIHQYQKEIKNKLEEERKMLVVAKAQKQTLIASKKDELKEYYDRKLISEQERMDIQLVEDLKKYDEKEKILRDGEIQKIQQAELKQQRDKKQMQFQTELNQLEDNYKKRLTNYQQLLREKFKKETSVLEEEAKKALGAKQKEIENIKIDVSNKDDMLREISRVQANENQLTQQIQEYDAKMGKQRDENIALQKKLESLKTKKQTMQTNNNHTIEKLKQEIKEKDKEIDRLFNSKRGIKDKYYHAGEKSYAKQRPTTLDQSNTSLNKIRQDVREIKSFITLKDVVGHSHSFSKGFHNDSHTNAPSRTMLHSNVTDKKEGASKKLRFTQGKTVEDWITTYHNETGKIEQQKKELKKEKISIKKAQEYLQDEQFRYKEEYSDLRLSPNKSFEKKSALKKAKMSLNDQVKRLNDDVYRLRETELLLKNKEKLLSTIGNMIRKMSIKDFDPEELEILYKEYQELDSESKQLVGKQHKRTDTTFSHDEPPEFYKRWESILENQLSLDVDTSVEEAKILKENRKQQYNFSEVMVERPLRPEIREEVSEDLTEPQSTKNADYSYQNLIKVLDLKLRSGVRGPENDYARRQRNLSTEHRYKMNAVFSEHSEWLKDMRTQLNRQLYDRPQSASTLVASRY